MKTKNFTKLIALFLLLVFAGSLKAQTEFAPYKSNVISYNGYSFPIIPGSDIWKNTSYSQRVEMLQIPVDTLKNISTKRLLETCLYYPFNIDIFLCDNQSEGFYKIRNQFNGYVELFKRGDFIQELITLYSSRDVSFVENINNDYERGQYSFDYKIMEIMMLEVLDSVPNQRSNQMANIVSEKQSQKAAYKEYYSNSNAAKQIINKSNQ